MTGRSVSQQPGDPSSGNSGPVVPASSGSPDTAAMSGMSDPAEQSREWLIAEVGLLRAQLDTIHHQRLADLHNEDAIRRAVAILGARLADGRRLTKEQTRSLGRALWYGEASTIAEWQASDD